MTVPATENKRNTYDRYGKEGLSGTGGGKKNIFGCGERLLVQLMSVYYVSQEDILITSEEAASHSGILRMFSGNSLVAETHLQISLVGVGRKSWAYC